MRKQLRVRVQGADGACPAPLQGFEEPVSYTHLTLPTKA